MINRFTYLLIFLTLALGSDLTAQSIQGLSENPVIKQYLNRQSTHSKQYSIYKSAAEETLLTLPFFEDFSVVSVFPDATKWSDRCAFINTSFDIDPISIGVATLDAIDEYGEVYNISKRPRSSDTLTSRGFELSSYSFPSDTVRLSFFFQCGGRGETPEFGDSLLLEFYSPVTAQWSRAWDTTLNYNTEFRQVIVVVDSVYYKSGFRFRFRNYTSVSPENVFGGEGAVGNADCWNLDYIMMNTRPEAEHFSINDITLTEPPRNLLGFYETVPWLHLNSAQELTRNYITYPIRNLNKSGEPKNVGRNYYVKDLNTGITTSFEIIRDPFLPDTLTRMVDMFTAPFVREDDSNEGTLEVVSYLVPDAGQELQNDTSRSFIHFRDYYAYDDGSPEFGFGIAGPSMPGALLAYRFRIFQTDTLRAVDFYFNKTINDIYEELEFRLCVWKDYAGKPGELLYMSDELYTPDYSTDRPEFKRVYVRANQDLVITDTSLFVGLKQETDQFLNLGYDVSRNNLNRTYVNISGNWFNPGNSMIPGTIMIRAVFGAKDLINDVPEITNVGSDIVLFPNPVSETLHIRSSETKINSISFVDMTGRLIHTQEGTCSTLDVSWIPPGVYQVVISTSKHTQVHRKIIIAH
ncbi:MAG: T9SS type A sorting domain-containing protein [Bacteroidales bacterium]